MAGSARKALEEQLGAKVPKGLVTTLDDSELARLADTVRQARDDQARDLDRALEDALGHVPRLMRGAIRRIVFG